jgi:hypothetical protein
MLRTGIMNHDQFRRVWEEAPSRRKKPRSSIPGLVCIYIHIDKILKRQQERIKHRRTKTIGSRL